MARLAVFASGNGGNFEALVQALRDSARASAASPAAIRAPGHDCVLLIYDRKDAFAARRAERLGIDARHVSYYKRPREAAESEIAALLKGARADLVALAGFMRLLSPGFVEARPGRIVNIHPALLPRWPGVDSIRRAWEAGDDEFGVTAHFVDPGMDTGPPIASRGFTRRPQDSLADIEARVHELEHRLYPRVVLDLLDMIERGGSVR